MTAASFVVFPFVVNAVVFSSAMLVFSSATLAQPEPAVPVIENTPGGSVPDGTFFDEPERIVEGTVVEIDDESVTILVANAELTLRVPDQAVLSRNGTKARLTDYRVGERVQIATPIESPNLVQAIRTPRPNNTDFPPVPVTPTVPNDLPEVDTIVVIPEQPPQPMIPADRQPWIGLGIDPYDDNRSDGVPVLKVYEESPASTAGVEPGDTVTSVSGAEVHTSREIRTALILHPRDKPVELTVIRADQQLQIKLVPKVRPEELPPLVMTRSHVVPLDAAVPAGDDLVVPQTRPEAIPPVKAVPIEAVEPPSEPLPPAEKPLVPTDPPAIDNTDPVTPDTETLPDVETLPDTGTDSLEPAPTEPTAPDLEPVPDADTFVVPE